MLLMFFAQLTYIIVYNAIILCMINACKKCKQTVKPINNIKTLPGWKDNVHNYFNASLL